MGGVAGGEKALVELDGVSLVAHVRTRVAPQVGRVVISANRELARYGVWGDTVVADTIGDAGPLAGVQAALRVVTTPYVTLVPGDAPLVDRTLVARLSAALIARGATVVVPDDGERPQYLFAMLRVSPASIASLDAYLAAGHRSVHGWYASLDTHSHAPGVPPDHSDAAHHIAIVDARDIASSFTNVNTPDDLQAAARRRSPSHSTRTPPNP